MLFINVFKIRGNCRQFPTASSRLYSSETSAYKKTEHPKELATKFDSPDFFELDGMRIIPDSKVWNISTHIQELFNRRLLLENRNPLSLLKRRIINYFNSAYRRPCSSSPLFVVCENEPRLVTTFENFDSLLTPEDHPSRRKSDTYYVNENWCLRAHTSAHQVKLLRQGLDNFLVIGDVYRRDAIDKTHFPCFHQIEGVGTYAQHEIFGDNPARLFEEESLQKRTPEKQEQHTLETARALEERLKETLEAMCQEIFGNNVEQMRWVPNYFPFTHPSFELEILFNGEWLEILGCGIIEQKLLESAGAQSRVGWAFGLGLERLAMILYGIPDIRLFWSRDPGFLSQFSNLKPDEIIKYKAIGKQPPVVMDISFWLPRERTELLEETLRADVYDVIRLIGGDLVEQVHLFDEFENKKTGRKSQAYRIIYRSMERPITKDEVNLLHRQIERHLKEKFAVEIR